MIKPDPPVVKKNITHSLSPPRSYTFSFLIVQREEGQIRPKFR